MKVRILALILAAVVVFMLAACNDSVAGSTTESPTATVTDPQYPGGTDPHDPAVTNPDTEHQETETQETETQETETQPPLDPEAADRLKADLVNALTELLTGYSVNPKAVIPTSMRGDVSQYCIHPSEIVEDYSTSVRVSDMPVSGMGEQWHMVQDNLEQSGVFFTVLTAIDEVATLSIATFQTFFDRNPAATAVHTFEQGIYSVTIHYDQDSVAYVLDYTKTFPIFGEQKAQIALSMDRETRVKTVRIQLGNPNALAYTVSEDGYTFAIKYLGVRRAYFTVKEDEDGNYVGHINEFVGAADVEIQSAADFYITED